MYLLTAATEASTSSCESGRARTTGADLAIPETSSIRWRLVKPVRGPRMGKEREAWRRSIWRAPVLCWGEGGDDDDEDEEEGDVL